MTGAVKEGLTKRERMCEKITRRSSQKHKTLGAGEKVHVAIREVELLAD